MRPLTSLPTDELRLAQQTAETLIRFKAYLPPGGLLLMLVSKFRDDIRDVLGMEIGGLPRRGTDRRSLDELTSVELNTVTGATGILLDRFEPYMDDPALPRLLTDFREALNDQKGERAAIQESIGA
jgi:hypothetical protein